MSSAEKNPFLQGTLPGLFVRTAAPILLVMATNGLVNIADAWYLGRYTGQPALTAVTIVFPLYLVMIALATLVGGGMASMLARALGADEEEQARIVFSSANWLALIAAIIVAAVFQLFGTWTTLALSGGNAMLADAGHTYLEILVWGSPVFFVLSVNGDAFRCEGRMNLVAAIALLVNAANIAFNYVLIARLGYGVAGAATGTVLAQCTALVFAASIRRRDKGILACQRLKWRLGSMEASRILALGAPQSLTFLGLSVHASAVLFMLQQHAGDSYSATVAAYGIVSRIMTFLYLPMIGLALAMQTIAGNNFGAGLFARSNSSLKIALAASLIYCAGMELIMWQTRTWLGSQFVNEPATVEAFARIVPIVTACYFLQGPIMMTGFYFQAVGEAAKTALLTLPRLWLIAIPLVFALPSFLGERGIWIASPVTDILMLCVTIAVLTASAMRREWRYGLFRETLDAGLGRSSDLVASSNVAIEK